MPTMFKKIHFGRWVCEDRWACEEHPEYQVKTDFINNQLVLLKHRRELERFSKWADLEAFVKKDVEA